MILTPRLPPAGQHELKAQLMIIMTPLFFQS